MFDKRVSSVTMDSLRENALNSISSKVFQNEEIQRMSLSREEALSFIQEKINLDADSYNDKVTSLNLAEGIIDSPQLKLLANTNRKLFLQVLIYCELYNLKVSEAWIDFIRLCWENRNYADAAAISPIIWHDEKYGTEAALIGLCASLATYKKAVFQNYWSILSKTSPLRQAQSAILDFLSCLSPLTEYSGNGSISRFQGFIELLSSSERSILGNLFAHSMPNMQLRNGDDFLRLMAYGDLCGGLVLVERSALLQHEAGLSAPTHSTLFSEILGLRLRIACQAIGDIVRRLPSKEIDEDWTLVGVVSALFAGDQTLALNILKRCFSVCLVSPATLLKKVTAFNAEGLALESLEQLAVLITQINEGARHSNNSYYDNYFLEETQNNPLVTVVIPAYNVEKYIKVCLESVRIQTFRDFECLVVDDCATDGTAQIIDEYCRQDHRFHRLQHRANSGLSASRNTGLRAARGRYVTFLDADDLMLPNSLKVRAIELINSELSESIIGSFCGSISIAESAAPPNEKEVKLPFVDFVTSGGRCPFNANQPMFVTRLIRQLGGFDETLLQAEDYEFWMRILRNGFALVPCSIASVAYRQRQNSYLRRNPSHHLEVSMRLHDSCLATQSPDQKFSVAPVHLWKSLNDYRAQLDKGNRVAEFAGLMTASGSNRQDVVTTVVTQLPNFQPTLSRLLDFRKQFLGGFLRNFSLSRSSLARQAQQSVDNEFFQALEAEIGAECERVSKEDPDYISDRSDVCDWSEIIRHPGLQDGYDVAFFPHKDYHVSTIGLMWEELIAEGLNPYIVDFSGHYRDEGVRKKAKELGLPLIRYSNWTMSEFKAKALVVFNDWDPILRAIMSAAQCAGVKTVAIVEGVQDYLDSDTGTDRQAYRTADTVLLPGSFDKHYFDDTEQNISVVGVPRVIDLLGKDTPTREGQSTQVLINSNFSYGVLEEERDTWLTTAVSAVREAGLTPVISRHPADKGTLFPELVSKDNYYDAIVSSDIVISRFGSSFIEVLALNRPIIYFKPAGETLDKFSDPMGAYKIVSNYEALLNEIAYLKESKGAQYRDAWPQFLAAHAFPESHQSGTPSPGRRIASEIASAAQATEVNEAVSYQTMQDYLSNLDRLTRGLSDIKFLRNMDLVRYPRGGSTIARASKSIEALLQDSSNHNGSKIRINQT